VTWVQYIARLIREGNEAELKTAWVELAAEWGTGQARDMWSLAKKRAAEADARGDVVQGALW
jgi:hypothetical protein